jgi:arylsulfatase A-like enzyme
MPERSKGKLLQQLVLNIDIAPTILDMAGIEIPNVMNGKSMLPLLKNPESDFREDFFMEHDSVVVAENPIPDSYGIRTKEWKYIRYVNPKPEVEEMYNLKKDPLEMKNLIDNEDFIQVKNELRKRFEEYREKLSE